jgi:type IV secretory pathway TraG/TraD family ATPase VirD4
LLLIPPFFTNFTTKFGFYMSKPHPQQTAQVQPHKAVSKKSDLPIDPLLGSLLLGVIGILVFVAIFGQKNNEKQGRSYWGGSAQMKEAETMAQAVIPAFNNQKSYTKPNDSALYIGTPAKIYNAHQQDFYQRLQPQLNEIERLHGKTEREKIEKKYRPRKARWLQETIYLANSQQSIIAFGAAGSGKSFSVINPLIRSGIDQGFPVTVYDFKFPEQTKEIAGYAAQRGYKIQIIAPSFAESGVFNIFDFIRDSGDSIGSGQMAATMTDNSGSEGDSSNPFFEDGGAATLSAVMLICKWLEEDAEAVNIARRIWGCKEGDPNPSVADILSCAAVLNMPGFAERVQFAEKRLNPWIMQELGQYLGAGGGAAQPGQPGKPNVTQGGIIANSQKTINLLIKRDFIPATCGKSTINIDMDEKNAKTLTIVGMNQDYRHMIAPLMATAIDLLVSRNVAHSRHRTMPFMLSLDEAPTVKLKKLANYLAEARSAGFIGLIAAQNYSQFVEAYGEERTKTIMGNCATKFFLNPQDANSAKAFSEYLGEKEIRYYTRSTSSQRGKSGGGSTSRNEQVTKVPLFEAAEFLKLKAGKMVIVSPGYKNPANEETYLPILKNVKIPKMDLEESKKSAEAWKVMQAAAKKQEISNAEVSRMFSMRKQLVEELFPLPPAKLKYPLVRLVQILGMFGYSEAGYEVDNRSIDLEQLVGVPDAWIDPSSTPDAPKVRIPRDEKSLSMIATLVGATGYRIHRKELVGGSV